MSLICILFHWHIFNNIKQCNTLIQLTTVFKKFNSIERPGKQIIVTGMQRISQPQLHKVKCKCASFVAGYFLLDLGILAIFREINRDSLCRVTKT